MDVRRTLFCQESPYDGIHDLTCRVCLTPCTTASANAISMQKVYNLMTGFVIRDKDIPKKLCGSCVNRLADFFGFIQLSIETEGKLSFFDDCSPKLLEATPTSAVEEDKPQSVPKKPADMAPFKCDRCEKLFKKKVHLKGHIQRVHGERGQCPVCDREMQSYLLARHVKNCQQKDAKASKTSKAAKTSNKKSA